MSIVGWLILGLVAGFIASKLVNRSGQGLALDVVLGTAGTVIGGSLFSLVGVAPMAGLNIFSLVVAVIGAVGMLCVYHGVAGYSWTTR